MNGGASLAFPGSRTLAGWWRQLALYRPQTLAVAHLLFHRVRAAVSLARSFRPDRFALLLLEALQSEQHSPPPENGVAVEVLARLDDRFHLGRPLLRQAMRGLSGEGLVNPDADVGWKLTAAGQQALESGEYQRPTCERRGVHFLQPPSGA